VLPPPVDPARAQQQPATPLPPVTVQPPQPPPVLEAPPNQGNGNGNAAGSKDEGHGDKASLDRLNNQLKRKVDEVNPTDNTPPLNASSPDTKVGVVNVPAVQQQYGPNFGHSAVPYRPPAPVYSSPIGPHR
jgi:hypothetical protein